MALAQPRRNASALAMRGPRASGWKTTSSCMGRTSKRRQAARSRRFPCHATEPRPYRHLNQIFAAHGQHPDLKPFATALMLVAAEGTDKVSSSEYAELARSFSQEVDAVKTSMRVRMERTVQGPTHARFRGPQPHSDGLSRPTLSNPPQAYMVYLRWKTRSRCKPQFTLQ